MDDMNKANQNNLEYISRTIGSLSKVFSPKLGAVFLERPNSIGSISKAFSPTTLTAMFDKHPNSIGSISKAFAPTLNAMFIENPNTIGSLSRAFGPTTLGDLFNKHHNKMDLLSKEFSTENYQKQWEKIAEALVSVNVQVQEPMSLNIKVLEPTIIVNDNNIEENYLDNFSESVKTIFPEFARIIDSLREKKYSNLVIYAVLLMILYFMQTIISDTDKYYKINRDFAPIKMSPEKGVKNIINRLDKDTFVEKIDEEGVYIKIQYTNKDGESKEGWVYRNLITEWPEN